MNVKLPSSISSISNEDTKNSTVKPRQQEEQNKQQQKLPKHTYQAICKKGVVMVRKSGQQMK